jgi:septum site-determining protein MinC
MNAHVGRTSAISLGARSLLAFVLEPKAPLKDWYGALDEWLARTPNFFSAKPVILQMGGLNISLKEYRTLLSQLALRHVRVMAVENTSPTLIGPHLPPIVNGGREANVDKLLGDEAAENSEKASAAPMSANSNEAVEETAPSKTDTAFEETIPAASETAASPSPLRGNHYHDGNLRSGQKIMHLDGDVTVMGRVASGAEIVAGGTVHIYGSLQGRVFAGVAGAADARIFCREARAELLCIGEAFVTAEDLDPKFEGAAIEASLENGRIKIRVLN